MFITRIAIKNFMGIKSIDINLETNKNGIEEDVALNRFKIINKKPIIGITALIGRNSVGKTTIIRAIDFISRVEMGFISSIVINSLINKELNNLEKKLFNKNTRLNEYDMLELNRLRTQKSKDIEKGIKNKNSEYFKKYIFESDQWFLNFFKIVSNNPKLKEIKFEIYFSKKNNQFGKYFMTLNNDGKISRKTTGDFQINEYQKYFANVIITVPSFLNLHKDQIQIISLERMIKMIGEKVTTNLLKLCDEDIKGIKYISKSPNHIQIKGVFVKDKIIDPNNLSEGTKKFIILVEAIVYAYKNKLNQGILLLDEIESSLHKELLQAIIQMLISLFKDSNIQSIITTHDLGSLRPSLSYKQIFSIEKNDNDENHTVTKLSTVMKPHENILTKQEQGVIACYPNEELIKNTIAKFTYELKNE